MKVSRNGTIELNMKMSRIGTIELNMKMSRIGARAQHEDETDWY
jgi:hypothetical protein